MTALGGRRHTATRTAVAGSVSVALAVTSAALSRAFDGPEPRPAQVATAGDGVTPAVVDVDTDGDGWTDWIELVRGGAPEDPASMPSSVTLDLVGTTAYVHPVDAPDGLALVAHDLPEGTISGRDLLATFGGLAGLASTGVVRDRLAGLIDRLYAGGLAGEEPLRKRTRGMDISLTAGGPGAADGAGAAEIEGRNRVTVGTDARGDAFVVVDNGRTVQAHTAYRQRRGATTVESLLATVVRNDSGGTVVYWDRVIDGRIVGHGKRVTRRDGSSRHWTYDEDGMPRRAPSPVSPAGVPVDLPWVDGVAAF